MQIMDLSALREIGMNDAEIRIYAVLVSHGSMSAREIAKKSGLYRPYVYDTLARLMERGLVTHYQRPKNRVYQAVSPDRIIDIMDHTRRRVAEAAGQLRERYHKTAGDDTLRVFEGSEGLKVFYEELLAALVGGESDHLYVIGGTGEAADHTYSFFPHLLRRGAEHGLHEDLDIRLIYNHDARGSEIPRRYSDLVAIRFTPPEFDCEATFILTEGMAATMVLKDRPGVFCTTNRHIIQAYHTVFARLWDFPGRGAD
ncbi:MAG: TrmB family transcriptional regulator [Methanomicrobiales archaeon]